MIYFNETIAPRPHAESIVPLSQQGILVCAHVSDMGTTHVDRVEPDVTFGHCDLCDELTLVSDQLFAGCLTTTRMCAECIESFKQELI